MYIFHRKILLKAGWLVRKSILLLLLNKGNHDVTLLFSKSDLHKLFQNILIPDPLWNKTILCTKVVTLTTM
jgi:hypothetical protein